VGIVLRKSLISLLTVLAAAVGYSQSRVSADVEVKTLYQGQVKTVTKRVFCNGNGRVVTVFTTPSESYVISNLKGEMKMYLPETKEVFSDRKEEFSTRDELLYIFLAGRSADLGLSGLGYKLQSSVFEEGGFLKRTYVTSKAGSVPKVEVVLKDSLPVYVAYLDGSGAVVSKTYLSGYDYSAPFVFPSRVTGIDYTKDRDSTVTRTIYSRVSTDSDDPLFGFEVPSDAIPVKKSVKK